MKTSVRFCGFLLLVLFLLSCTKQNQFTSVSGESISLNDKSRLGVVCMFITPDCPLSQSYAKTFVDIEGEFGSSFTFFAAVPGTTYSSEEIDHFVDSFHFDLPIVVDSTFNLTNRWKAKVTPEIFVMRPSGGVEYSGSIDNWAIKLSQKRLKPSKFYLVDALRALVTKQVVPIAKTTAVGCVIEKDDPY